MIFSYLFLQTLKIIVFLAIPGQVIIRNLQVKTQNEHSQQKNKKALTKLILVGVIYSLYTLVECLNFSSEVCLFWLVVLAGAAIYLTAFGYTNLGIQKVVELLEGQKLSGNISTKQKVT